MVNDNDMNMVTIQMSNLEKRLKGIQIDDGIKFDQSILDADMEDEETVYAKQFIAARLADAQYALGELMDYLKNSDYAKERGGEHFKEYLEKVTNIYDQIDKI